LITTGLTLQKVNNWTNTAESKQYIMAIMDKHASVRKKYGKLNIQIS